MNSRAQAWLREPLTRHLTWTIAFSVMIAALLWPALWNGFPIVFDDTGGVFARPLLGGVLFGGSAFYSGVPSFGISLRIFPPTGAPGPPLCLCFSLRRPINRCC